MKYLTGSKYAKKEVSEAPFDGDKIIAEIKKLVPKNSSKCMSEKEICEHLMAIDVVKGNHYNIDQYAKCFDVVYNEYKPEVVDVEISE